MGIVNVTPDSFYAGSRTRLHELAAKVEKMVGEGAAIIDIGACSTRPGVNPVTAREEKERLFPALHTIRSAFPDLPISVDTFRAEIAEESVSVYGADIINDVSAGELDHRMFSTVARLKVPYVLTHPGSHFNPAVNAYAATDVTAEVIEYLALKASHLMQMGVGDIIVDPGFGFGKTLEQNYALLRHLEQIAHMLQMPVLVGVSRKTMIRQVLGCSSEEALTGTVVLNTCAMLRRASIVRVHDVKEAVEAVRLLRFC